MIRTLLVEHSAADARLLFEALRSARHVHIDIRHVTDLESALRELRKGGVDLVLLDLTLPDEPGVRSVERTRTIEPSVPIVVLSAAAEESIAIRAVEAGAQDYLLKGEANAESVLRSIRYALGRARAEEAVREIESQAEQARKMETLGRLTTGIAHDVNNMLSAILGFTELAAQQIKPSHPAREYLDQVSVAGNRVAHLMRQILSFSRKQPVTPQVLNVNRVISDMHRMLRRLVREDIELIFSLPPGVPPIMADRGRVEQLLLNLVVNAGEAMPEGGRLAVETFHANLDEDKANRLRLTPGHYAVLQVRDSGVGMDSSERRRAFQPFFTTKPRGTGLGLSTVREVVRQLGGGIDLVSAPQQGACFTIYLPAFQDEERRDAVPAEAPPPGGTETVLLVEDEPDLRRLLRTMLGLLGYRVLDAANGTEAYQISQRYTGPIHLLLTDVVMPFMRGTELARVLMSERPALKVLFISGYAEGPAVEREVRFAGQAFLQKPFSTDELARKVRMTLDAAPAPSVGSPGPQ
ncbi:MAG: response regulator [Planctomycetes bacterium]|nr:response regulator [Planctomycetota bacterium]